MRKGLTAGIISIATAAAVIAGPTAAFASTGHSTQTATVSVKDAGSVDHSGTNLDKIRDKRNSSGPDRTKDGSGSKDASGSGNRSK